MTQHYTPSSTLKQRYRGLGCVGDRLKARERHALDGDIYRDEGKRVRERHTRGGQTKRRDTYKVRERGTDLQWVCEFFQDPLQPVCPVPVRLLCVWALQAVFMV